MFKSHVDYVTLPSPESIVAADLNNDGKLDIAIFSSQGTLETAILLGNGDGTFSRFAQYPSGCRSLGAGCIATTADLNGDNKADLVVRNFFNNAVSVLLGNGDG